MPASFPPTADVQASNAFSDRQDVPGSGTEEADADPKISSRSFSSNNKASSKRSGTSSTHLPSEDIRNQSMNQSSPHSKKGRQNSQDGLLHITTEGGATRRPIETSIWDWDTPLETVGESSSYYYEPQGELLQEKRDYELARTEFTIPHAVAGSATDFPISTSPAGLPENDGFAVPRRPSSIQPPTSIAGTKRKSTSDRDGAGAVKQDAAKKTSRVMSESGGEDPKSPAHNTRSQSGSGTRQDPGAEASEVGPGSSVADVDFARPQDSTDGGRRTLADCSIPMVLPARKVFPIQIGDKLFRLSGASISSDAPSYFSQFFEEQLRQNEGADSVRTLYIDRDPTTFEDISLHLQGYHIEPRDGPHFVKLFADAQFFSLPRLTAQLFTSTIYIRIGNEEFQIPRDLFGNPGDSPNYFTLGFSVFFTSPNEVFPGLSQRTLLRPPSILPPCVPNRSAKTFSDLMQVLKGYPVEVRSEEHRGELLRDARYFHLKGLEQRLIPHQISYNLARKKSEILIRLEDIRQSGVSFVADSSGQSSAAESPESGASSTPTGPGWVYYQRPYVDSEAYNLVFEVAGEESTFLSIAPSTSSSPARVGRATFLRQTLARITSLFSVISSKMNLPVTQPLGLIMMERNAGATSLPVSPRNTGVSDERVKVRIGADAEVIVDGTKWFIGEEGTEAENDSQMDVDPAEAARAGKKRKRNEDGEDEGEEWIIRKAQYRLRVQPPSGGAQAGKAGMEVILGAVKIEAYSNERARNAARGFLV